VAYCWIFYMNYVMMYRSTNIKSVVTVEMNVLRIWVFWDVNTASLDKWFLMFRRNHYPLMQCNISEQCDPKIYCCANSELPLVPTW